MQLMFIDGCGCVVNVSDSARPYLIILCSVCWWGRLSCQVWISQVLPYYLMINGVAPVLLVFRIDSVRYHLVLFSSWFLFFFLLRVSGLGWYVVSFSNPSSPSLMLVRLYISLSQLRSQFLSGSTLSLQNNLIMPKCSSRHPTPKAADQPPPKRAR